MDEDTGTRAEVPEDERLDVDEGEGTDASEGGPDDDLSDVYDDPGDVVALLGIPEGAPEPGGRP